MNVVVAEERGAQVRRLKNFKNNVPVDRHAPEYLLAKSRAERRDRLAARFAKRVARWAVAEFGVGDETSTGPSVTDQAQGTRARDAAGDATGISDSASKGSVPPLPLMQNSKHAAEGSSAGSDGARSTSVRSIQIVTRRNLGGTVPVDALGGSGGGSGLTGTTKPPVRGSAAAARPRSSNPARPRSTRTHRSRPSTARVNLFSREPGLRELETLACDFTYRDRDANLEVGPPTFRAGDASHALPARAETMVLDRGAYASAGPPEAVLERRRDKSRELAGDFDTTWRPRTDDDRIEAALHRAAALDVCGNAPGDGPKMQFSAGTRRVGTAPLYRPEQRDRWHGSDFVVPSGGSAVRAGGPVSGMGTSEGARASTPYVPPGTFERSVRARRPSLEVGDGREFRSAVPRNSRVPAPRGSRARPASAPSTPVRRNGTLRKAAASYAVRPNAGTREVQEALRRVQGNPMQQ